MSHARTQIRDALVSAVTGLSTTGASVFASRVYPQDDPPCLAVWTRGDIRQEEGDTLGKLVRQDLEGEIIAFSKPDPAVITVVDQLDQICAEVEAALTADLSLGNRVRYLELTGTLIEISGDLERPSGTAIMRWRCVYGYVVTDPETIVSL